MLRISLGKKNREGSHGLSMVLKEKNAQNEEVYSLSVVVRGWRGNAWWSW
jgi:hypothetical protein